MIQTVRHATLELLARALQAHAVWFPGDLDLSTASSGLHARAWMHVHECANALVIQDLTHADLMELSASGHVCWLTDPLWLPVDDSREPVGSLLSRQGWHLFGTPRVAASIAATVTSPLEFVLSSSERLEAMPQASTRSDGGTPWSRARRAVFVFDLVQDVEILQDLVRRAATGEDGITPIAAVTDRVLQSHVGAEFKQFLQALDVPWFRPIGAVDVAAALGGPGGILLTASESTAPGHSFARSCCRIAPVRTLRVTFQHGFECIGLLHHRAHDLQFPQGVRFASDVIFTWRRPDQLPQLQGTDAGRAVAVGVTKGIAHSAERIRLSEWGHSAGVTSDEAWLGLGKTSGALLVAENLHSVRFSSPARYRRFLQFIEKLTARHDTNVLIRSHPGKRVLERKGGGESHRFLEGTLRAEHLRGIGGLVSPPSTIVLDAALCSAPVAVWTDSAAIGDVSNYRGLPHVRDLPDLKAAFGDRLALQASAASAATPYLKSLKWAVENTVALNGTHHAWRYVCSRTA